VKQTNNRRRREEEGERRRKDWEYDLSSRALAAQGGSLEFNSC
jgi:hypothetical protein